jgi:branched-chain amino acid aminotransferase
LAVYEGIRVYDVKVVELDAHIDRLYASATEGHITIPLTPKWFREAIVRTIKENGFRDCHLAPWVGYGEPRKRANMVIRIRKIPRSMGQPLSAIVSSVRRAAPDSIPAQIKTNSHLDLMLARVEVEYKGANYAIMLDRTGYMAEASLANIMIVGGEAVYTPYTTSALEGITRGLLLKLLPENGVSAFEKNLTLQDL